MPILLMILLLAGMNANAAPADQALTIPIMAMNNSGQTGTATLTPEGDRTRVVVELSGIAAGVVEPAHIHLVEARGRQLVDAGAQSPGPVPGEVLQPQLQGEHIHGASRQDAERGA